MQLTKSEQVILKYLSDNCDEALYESEIAKNAYISVGSANQTLKALYKKDMVVLSKKGNMNFYKLDLGNPLVRQFKITQTISEINGLVNRLKPIVSRIILFGSCATGEDTKKSDIDIFVVSSDKAEILNRIASYRSRRKIQYIIKSHQEYIQLDKKDSTLYEQVQKGILLWEKE